MTHTFKPLASIAFTNWTQEQCKWIVSTAKVGDIARKVALYVLKKKYEIIVICTLFCTTSCTPIIRTARLERQKARADSILIKSPSQQREIQQKKKFNNNTATLSIFVFAGWLTTWLALTDKD